MNDIKETQEIELHQEQGFFDRSKTIRFFIISCFALCLFLFLHFREARVEVLEINSIAPRFIVAQIDFKFFDEEATIILKQEAIRDLGKVYRIKQQSAYDARKAFEKALVTDDSWRKTFKDVSLEQMYEGAGYIEKILQSLHFSDPRTIQKMEKSQVDTTNYLVFTPSLTRKKTKLTPHIWTYIETKALENKKVPPEALRYILQFFKSSDWEFEEDSQAARNIRQTIQKQIPDVYSKVRAGNRIIDKGDKVTTRHIQMLQAMKNALSKRRHLWHPLTFLGSAFMTVLLLSVSWVYLYYNHKRIFNSNKKLFLLTTIAILTLLISKVIEYILLNAAGNIIEWVRFPLFIPFSALLITSLLNARIASFMSIFLTLALAIALTFNTTGFILVNIAASIIVIFSARSLMKRKEIFVVCAKAYLVSAFVVFSIYLYDYSLLLSTIWADLLSTAFFMLATAVLVLGLLPLLESTFNLITDVTLTEYLDPNHPLLRRLTFEAPGTYQHSIIVGSIAERAALAISANGLFCRVACLYHDIGKVKTPHYFTENQQGEVNVHQLLTPLESAQTIMAHVSEGVALARKAGLPEPFIDIIKEHHGTTLVYFFYHKALEQAGGDKSKVNESDFRYSGPKPHSKESAIIMIADSFEAASRSLDTVNEETLTQLIDQLVKGKVEDGQLDECNLTFQELAIIKKTMVKTLIAATHGRIKYPSPNQKEKNLEALQDKSG